MILNGSHDIRDKTVTMNSVFTRFLFISVADVRGLKNLFLNLIQIDAYDENVISKANPINADITIMGIFLLNIM